MVLGRVRLTTKEGKIKAHFFPRTVRTHSISKFGFFAGWFSSYVHWLCRHNKPTILINAQIVRSVSPALKINYKKEYKKSSLIMMHFCVNPCFSWIRKILDVCHKRKKNASGKNYFQLRSLWSRNITLKFVTLTQNMHKVLKELQTMITKTKYYW